jgi:RNA polymerase sigma-70 factor (ECF subfamily)
VPTAHQNALSDDALLRQSASGDAAAFDEVVRRHQAAVFRFITTLGVAGADAEDALQDTFVNAWRGAPRFAGTGRVRSWLLTIARNAVRHQRRRHAGEPAEFLSVEELALRAGWGEEPAIVPDEGATDTLDRVRRAFERLGDEEREVLLLRDVEELTGEETARALNLTVAATKSRLHRARLRLAAMMKEGIDEPT